MMDKTLQTAEDERARKAEALDWFMKRPYTWKPGRSGWEGGPGSFTWYVYNEKGEHLIRGTWALGIIETLIKREAATSDVPAQSAALASKPVQGGELAGQWEGAEEWMPLAWELCANECGEESCTELIWEGGPIPEPWGDRWLKYEGQAKEMIAMVRKHVPALAAQPVREPMGWQPIETAPKDGTSVILFGDARWPAGVTPAHQDVIGAVGEGYFSGGFWQFIGMIGEPTHWMPLPAAPGATAVPAPAREPMSVESFDVIRGNLLAQGYSGRGMEWAVKEAIERHHGITKE